MKRLGVVLKCASRAGKHLLSSGEGNLELKGGDKLPAINELINRGIACGSTIRVGPHRTPSSGGE